MATAREIMHVGAECVRQDETLAAALPRLARASVEEVMAAVGRGEMRAADVVRAMHPDYKEERVARYGASNSACACSKSVVAMPAPTAPKPK